MMEKTKPLRPVRLLQPVLVLLTTCFNVQADSVRCLTEPVDDVMMSSIVHGTIARINFGEGSFVQKGSVILELESRPEELDVQRREVAVENLKATLERSEKLLQNTSSISMEEVDTARSDYKMAVLDLELARNALDNKKVVAPFSGVVTDLPLEVGEYCEPPQIIVRMVDTRNFYCVANIDPAIAAKLKLKDVVAFKLENANGAEPINGEIVFISPVVDPASGLLRIKAVFPNPNGIVRPGEGGFLELKAVP
ncbi:MAG: efflux RND transporter periplasmic adaptor subunit [Puniceicoccaceae bacterium]